MNKITGDILYLHSRCHNAHFELMYNLMTKSWFLVCERCRQPIDGITLIGPQLDGGHDECSDKVEDKPNG
jgi:hypothetical protein